MSAAENRLENMLMIAPFGFVFRNSVHPLLHHDFFYKKAFSYNTKCLAPYRLLKNAHFRSQQLRQRLVGHGILLQGRQFPIHINIVPIAAGWQSSGLSDAVAAVFRFFAIQTFEQLLKIHLQRFVSGRVDVCQVLPGHAMAFGRHLNRGAQSLELLNFTDHAD